MAVLNLNEFQEEIDEIVIGDKTFKIPKGIPEILYLELIEATSESMKTGMRKILNVLHKIFQIYQPELTIDEFGMMLTAEKKTAVLNFIMAGMSVEDTKKALEEATQQIKDGKKKPLQAES